MHSKEKVQKCQNLLSNFRNYYISEFDLIINSVYQHQLEDFQPNMILILDI